MQNSYGYLTNIICLLIRGYPGSGKTTLAKSLKLKTDYSFLILDPDTIETKSKKYRNFTPRMNKNPSEEVKKYCYLFNKAEKAIKNGENIIWTQPWSRYSEIELTIKNFAYYFTNLRDNVWNTNTELLFNKLPFSFVVIEVIVPRNLSILRTSKKYDKENYDEKRLIKTQLLFQSLPNYIPILKVSGEEHLEKSVDMITDFITTYKKQ